MKKTPVKAKKPNKWRIDASRYEDIYARLGVVLYPRTGYYITVYTNGATIRTIKHEGSNIHFHIGIKSITWDGVRT